MTMQENQAIELARGGAFALPNLNQMAAQEAAIRQFQAACQTHLAKGHDFGVIPGTQKPTLLKPGAEKIIRLLGLSDEYDIQERTEDWEKGFFRYIIRCKLVHLNTGVLISSGLGECNTKEGRYRWRNAARACPACGNETIIKGKAEYGGGWLCYKAKGGCGQKWPDGAQDIEGQQVGKVENEDIYSLVNTVLKMAKKRAMVDAALSAGSLSDVFTQDLDDMAENGVAPASSERQTPTPAGNQQRQSPPPPPRQERQTRNEPPANDRQARIDAAAAMKEAREALGMAVDDFTEHIQGQYRKAPQSLTLVEIQEVTQWLRDEKAMQEMPDDAQEPAFPGMAPQGAAH